MQLIKLNTFIALVLFSVFSWAEENAKHDLEKAFYKEYSFLLKEKRAMEQRLNQLKSQQQKELNQHRSQLQSFKSENDSLLMEVERVNEQIGVVERETLAKESNQSVFEATLEQATASLNTEADGELKAIGETISRGLGKIDNNSKIYVETNSPFFLQDGTEVSGKVIHYGAVARFGLANDAQGPLAPAGGGAFKLWQQGDEQVLSQLAMGQLPDQLPIFLYDSEMNEVKTVEDKDALTIINSGGPIAWVIVVLGGLALLLAALRATFLFTLGRSNATHVKAVAESVSQGDIETAKEQAVRIGGSLKRVYRSTLNNIQRDREHVEDTISEAILHEHSHLDRFHAMIMVIAAISPLLGLLGTVTGMIETFDVITEFGTGDPKLLSGGISIALVTTELGLIVAIPVLVIGTILASWSTRIKDDIEKSALHLVNQYHNNRSGA